MMGRSLRSLLGRFSETWTVLGTLQANNDLRPLPSEVLPVSCLGFRALTA